MMCKNGETCISPGFLSSTQRPLVSTPTQTHFGWPSSLSFCSNGPWKLIIYLLAPCSTSRAWDFLQHFLPTVGGLCTPSDPVCENQPPCVFFVGLFNLTLALSPPPLRMVCFKTLRSTKRPQGMVKFTVQNPRRPVSEGGSHLANHLPRIKRAMLDPLGYSKT